MTTTLGEFGRPNGAQVKEPALYREILRRYQPGVWLDYCAHTGNCGVVALELGHQFVGVEIMPSHFTTAAERLAVAATSATSAA